ncbi:MAG: RAD55 family ATPase [Halobacteriota archaeon]|nr:RAD55 family ATPase [Halobacteriota archaeon]
MTYKEAIQLQSRLIEDVIRASKDVIGISAIKMSAEQVTSQYPILEGLNILDDCTLDISGILEDIETSEMLEDITKESGSTNDDLSALKSLYLTALKALFENIYNFLSMVIGPDNAEVKIASSCKPFIDENRHKMAELGVIEFLPDIFAGGEFEKTITLESLKREDKVTQTIVIFQKIFTKYLKDGQKSDTLPMYKQKITSISTEEPLLQNFEISEDGSVNLEGLEGALSSDNGNDVGKLVNSLCLTFNSFVDLSSFILGKKNAFDSAKTLISPILSEYEEISEELDIKNKILKGAISDRISSGVENFDSLIYGGLLRGSSVVIQGPYGGEKEIFCNQFVKEGLVNDGAVVVVLSRMSPDEFKQQLKDIGVEPEEYEEKDLLKIVDWYSWKTENVIGVERDMKSVLKSSRDLSSVGIALGKAIDELAYAPVTRGFVEMLSPAMKDFDFEVVYDFSQSMRAKFRKNDITGLFLIEKKMHDPESLSALHQIFDGIIDIVRFREDKDKLTEKVVRKLAVSMVGTRFEPGFKLLELDKKGLSVKEGAVTAEFESD